MKLSRLLVGLALAGSIAIPVAYASGLFPNFPIVGIGTYCGGSISTATGTLTGVQTGCPNQVPAGPTVVTGSETIPADTNAASGANPQTVLLSLASLNALPLQFVTVTSTSPTGISATNISGGVCYVATGTITLANITLPATPIDGQRYTICANRTITTLAVSASPAGSAATLSVAGPTVLTASTSADQGYDFIYNRAANVWVKLR